MSPWHALQCLVEPVRKSESPPCDSVLVRVTFSHLLQVTITVPERILVVAERPGMRAELQPRKISQDVFAYVLTPCRLPILRMSLAAEFTDSSS